MRTPHYTDHCRHLTNGDIFVGSTIAPINGHPIDVYIWYSYLPPACEPNPRNVCIRFGQAPDEYIGCYGSPEEWSDPKREVQDVEGDMAPASYFDGPAMELVRAYLEKEKLS